MVVTEIKKLLEPYIGADALKSLSDGDLQLLHGMGVKDAYDIALLIKADLMEAGMESRAASRLLMGQSSFGCIRPLPGHCFRAGNCRSHRHL